MDSLTDIKSGDLIDFEDDDLYLPSTEEDLYTDGITHVGDRNTHTLVGASSTKAPSLYSVQRQWDGRKTVTTNPRWAHLQKYDAKPVNTGRTGGTLSHQDINTYSTSNVDEQEDCDSLEEKSNSPPFSRANVNKNIGYGRLASSKSLPEMVNSNSAIRMVADFPCLMQPFALDSSGHPTNWTRKEALNSDSEDLGRYQLHDLCSNDFEYQVIEREMKGAHLDVTRIERLQNHALLDTFKHQMSHLSNHRPPGYKLNQRYLYHGTNAPKEQICEEGLDMRLSRVGHFGRGTYFSDNPLKCIKYTKQDPTSSEMSILKCRVLLGDVKVYPVGESDSKLKREPAKEDAKGMWKYYDSVKGQPKDYTEYVVYQNSRVLVEYIVTFNKPDSLKAAQQPQNTSKTEGGGQRSKTNSTSDGSVEYKGQRSRSNSCTSDGSFEHKGQRSRSNSCTSNGSVEYEGQRSRSNSCTSDAGSVEYEGQRSCSNSVTDSGNDRTTKYDNEVPSPKINPPLTQQTLFDLDLPPRPKPRQNAGPQHIGVAMAAPSVDSHSAAKMEHVRKLMELKTLMEPKLSTMEKYSLQNAYEVTYGESVNAAAPQHAQIGVPKPRKDRDERPPGDTESYYTDAVLSSLMADFMHVTQVTNDNVARQYIEKANMDLDIAITLYYEDL